MSCNTLAFILAIMRSMAQLLASDAFGRIIFASIMLIFSILDKEDLLSG